MGVWADAVTARNDLRSFVRDNVTDRPVKNKLVLGPIDGVNPVFYTYEERIVAGTILFSYDYVEQPGSVIAAQDLIMGKFSLAPPPQANVGVRASYYWQLFLDSDLDEALQLAAGEIHETDDITTVQAGLKNAALHFAASFAFTNQSVRWLVQRASEKYLLQESPVEAPAEQRAKEFRDAATTYYKMGVELRSSFYQRHGRRDAPAWNVYKPVLPPIQPLR